MSSSAIRAATTFLVAAALAVAAVVVPPSVPATAAPACSSGVLVAVDFRPFGGGLQSGCDADPSTGRAALNHAGFATVDVTRQPGFVCRINGRPGPAADNCVNTPPASAYWSYWFAHAGQNRWTYSPEGAGTRKPSPGDVDAWVFGRTNVSGTTGQPCFSPADARAGRSRSCPVAAPPRRTSAPRTTSSRPSPPRTSRPVTRSTPAGRPTTAAEPTSTGAATPARRSATTPATRSAAPTTATASGPAPTASSSGAVAVPFERPSPAAADQGGSDSALPLVIVLIVVAALGAGAGVTVLRRRRLSE
ncbi:hypothetical protein [Jatrophihabitans fulvus]